MVDTVIGVYGFILSCLGWSTRRSLVRLIPICFWSPASGYIIMLILDRWIKLSTFELIARGLIRMKEVEAVWSVVSERRGTPEVTISPRNTALSQDVEGRW